MYIHFVLQNFKDIKASKYCGAIKSGFSEPLSFQKHQCQKDGWGHRRVFVRTSFPMWLVMSSKASLSGSCSFQKPTTARWSARSLKACWCWPCHFLKPTMSRWSVMSSDAGLYIVYVDQWFCDCDVSDWIPVGNISWVMDYGVQMDELFKRRLYPMSPSPQCLGSKSDGTSARKASGSMIPIAFMSEPKVGWSICLNDVFVHYPHLLYIVCDQIPMEHLLESPLCPRSWLPSCQKTESNGFAVSKLA